MPFTKWIGLIKSVLRLSRSTPWCLIHLSGVFGWITTMLLFRQSRIQLQVTFTISRGSSIKILECIQMPTLSYLTPLPTPLLTLIDNSHSYYQLMRMRYNYTNWTFHGWWYRQAVMLILTNSSFTALLVSRSIRWQWTHKYVPSPLERLLFTLSIIHYGQQGWLPPKNITPTTLANCSSLSIDTCWDPTSHGTFTNSQQLVSYQHTGSSSKIRVISRGMSILTWENWVSFANNNINPSIPPLFTCICKTYTIEHFSQDARLKISNSKSSATTAD